MYTWRSILNITLLILVFAAAFIIPYWRETKRLRTEDIEKPKKKGKTVKAIWNNTVLAEAEKNDLIRIEGNWYFPPSSVKREYFKDSASHTTCPWKGLASYYDVVVGDQTNTDAAWYYPEPKDGSVERVGRDFSNYVAFWHGVEVVE